jgi:hypothetical protein
MLSLICSERMDFSEQYHIEGEVWDTMRSSIRAQDIIDSMFIKDLLGQMSI